MLHLSHDKPAPPKPKPSLLFTTGEDPFSLSIQMLTASPASHVAICLNNGKNEIVHAIRKVRHENRSRLYTKYAYKDVAEFLILPEVNLDHVMSQTGKLYDFDEVITGFFMRGIQLAAPWVTRAAVATGGKWTCARLALALDPKRNIIPEWRGLNPEGITPDELLQTMAGPSFYRIR